MLNGDFSRSCQCLQTNLHSNCGKGEKVYYQCCSISNKKSPHTHFYVFLRYALVMQTPKKQRGGSNVRTCHGSKYSRISFSYFPPNFISFPSASEIAGWLIFPDAMGVCGYCSRLWRQHSCRWWTTPLIRLCFLCRPRQSAQFASLALSYRSQCQERREKKGGSRGEY